MRRGATASNGSAPSFGRRLVIAVAAAVVAWLLVGCANGPNQVGAAAIVGDTVIPLETVRGWFDRVVADRERKERARANGQFDDIGRLIVTEAIRHELLRQAAERENLRVSENQVTELLDQLGGPARAVESQSQASGAGWLLYDETNIRDRVRDQLVELELARKYYDSTRIKFHGLDVEERDEALGIARQLADDPSRVRDIIEDARGKGLPAGADIELSLSDSPQEAARLPLFAVPAGSAMVLACHAMACVTPSAVWEVVYVEERESDAPPSTNENKVDVDAVNESDLAGVGQRLLAPLMRDVRVELNPRYGVWESVNLEAVENDGERKVTTFAATSRS
jgi:hypothetical protein